MLNDDALVERAERHAALGDPMRLAIVEELSASDRSPIELRQRLNIESNLLAHHLDVLERVGLIERFRSSGDGRRRYVHLLTGVLNDVVPRPTVPLGPALFVCTANSARSQLAAALWSATTGETAVSAGTKPADQVHPKAIAAARRADLDLSDAQPKLLSHIDQVPALVVTVCDRAHEELEPDPTWLHWSVTDPVPTNTAAAFDGVVQQLNQRISTLVGAR